MSSVIIFLAIAVIGWSLIRQRPNQGKGNRQLPRTPQQRYEPPYQQRPYHEQPDAPQPSTQPSRPQPGQEQSAWDWMHSRPQPTADTRDPEGETLMYRDVPEDWIRPVEATVRVDLTEIRETQREIVHESVHESLHVRRDAASGTPKSARRQAGKIGLHHANLAQALILAEALGEPRSKRPWKPQRRR